MLLVQNKSLVCLCMLDMNILIKLKNKNQSKADKLLHVAFMSVCVAVNAIYEPSIKHSIE